jgi:hypothetical protein
MKSFGRFCTNLGLIALFIGGACHVNIEEGKWKRGSPEARFTRYILIVGLGLLAVGYSAKAAARDDKSDKEN